MRTGDKVRIGKEGRKRGGQGGGQDGPAAPSEPRLCLGFAWPASPAACRASSKCASMAGP